MLNTRLQGFGQGILRTFFWVLVVVFAFQPIKMLAQEKASSASLATEAEVGRISSLIGNVTILRDKRRLRGAKGSEIREGDRLLSGKNSLAKILLVGDESFTLLPETEIEIRQQKVFDGVLESTKRLFRGKIHFFTRPRDAKFLKSKFESQNALMGVRGTSGLIEVDVKRAEVSVLEGNVSLRSKEETLGSVDVPAGFRSIAEDGKVPSVPVPYDTAKVKDLIQEVQKVSPVLDSHQGFEKSPQAENRDAQSSEESNNSTTDEQGRNQENDRAGGSEKKGNAPQKSEQENDKTKQDRPKVDSKLDKLRGKTSTLPTESVDSHLLPARPDSRGKASDVTELINTTINEHQTQKPKENDGELQDKLGSGASSGGTEAIGAGERTKQTFEQLKSKTDESKKEIEQDLRDRDSEITIELPQR